MRRMVINNEDILLDEGIFFAKGVFETIAWESAAILFDKHIERLKKGMIELGLDELEEEELREYFKNVNIRNKAVKITVTPLNIIITSRKNPYDSRCKDYDEGCNLIISEVRRNSTSRLCYIKSTGYIENILEKQEAMSKGYKDALFLNENGHITETTCANIFIITNDMIMTPRIQDGLLSGIIRGWIIENFEVEEKSLTIEDLYNADEVFITNSLMGIMPVKLIESMKYNNFKKTNVIRDIYEDVKLQLGGI